MKHYSSLRRIGVSTAYTLFFTPSLSTAGGKNVHLLPSFSSNFPKFGNREPRLSNGAFPFVPIVFFTVYYRSLSLSLLYTFFTHTNFWSSIIWRIYAPGWKIKRGRERGSNWRRVKRAKQTWKRRKRLKHRDDITTFHRVENISVFRYSIYPPIERRLIENSRSVESRIVSTSGKERKREEKKEGKKGMITR